MIFISPFFYNKGKKVSKCCCLSGMQMFSEKAWTRHTHKDTHNFVLFSWNKAQLLWLFAMHTKRLGPSQEKLHSFLIFGALLKTHRGKSLRRPTRHLLCSLYFYFSRRGEEIMPWTIEMVQKTSLLFEQTVKQLKWKFEGLL